MKYCINLLCGLLLSLFSLTAVAQQAPAPQPISAYEVNSDFNQIPKGENATLRFQFGSCALYMKGVNGRRMKILKSMTKQPADFMIWLGDHLYFLQKSDWETRKGMEKKYRYQRDAPYMKEFLQCRPQYAIWDDHEYGSNDADGHFAYKDTSLLVFKEFWKNPAYGTDELPGTFFKVKHGDCEFFMTDGRFYADKTPLADGSGWTAMFGAAQMEWLKASLRQSTARFKFVVCGSQIISNPKNVENLGRYPKERDELLNFLKTEDIKGVIFLSGDRHFADLSKMEREGTYPLYDFTSSSLTSPHLEYAMRNDYRVKGTETDRHNFGRITLTGIGDDRVCIFELFDVNAKLIWTYNIKASELR